MSLTQHPMYVMKVGAATNALKNHRVLWDIARMAKHHLRAAGLLIEDDQSYGVQEFTTREQAAVAIQNVGVQNPVLIVIDDHSDVNNQAKACYPQPRLLYFTGSYIVMHFVFGTSQKFKERCIKFAERCLREDQLLSVVPMMTLNACDSTTGDDTTSSSDKSSVIQANKDSTPAINQDRQNNNPYECYDCLNGKKRCFCMAPVIDLLLQHHRCSDPELIQHVENFLATVVPYSPEIKHDFLDNKATQQVSKGETSAVSQPKGASLDNKEKERLMLEESLTKTLGISKQTNKEGVSETEDESQLKTTTSPISTPNVPLLSIADDVKPKVTSGNLANGLSSKASPTTKDLDSLGNASPKKHGKLTNRVMVRTPIMETEAVSTRSLGHQQFPTLPLGTSYDNILKEIGSHDLSIMQLRAAFATNLSRSHEMISQQKLTDELYCDITRLNSAIENDLKQWEEQRKEADYAALTCWVALIAYHCKLMNLLLMVSQSSLALPEKSSGLLRAATRKIIEDNPEAEVIKLLRTSIALFADCHKKHDLADLIPTFFCDAHKIALLIMMIRLEQVLSRIQAVNVADVTIDDASRLVRKGTAIMEATANDVAERYADFFNVVCQILRERWNSIRDPFPDFAFTSSINN